MKIRLIHSAGKNCIAKIPPSLALVLLIISAFLRTSTAYAALSGTYTICGSGCDYLNFGDAISALNSQGVSGPVTFNVKAGTYSGNSSMGSISGSSATNTITFNGAGMYNTIWSNSSSYVLALSGSSYINFNNMQFNFSSSGETIYLNSASNITFDHCRIVAPTYGSPSYLFCYTVQQYYCNNITYTNNRIEGGFYGAMLYGFGGYGNNIFKNNKVVQFYAAGLLPYYSTNDVIQYNVFDSSYAQGEYGMEDEYCNGSIITNNVFHECGMEAFGANNSSSTALFDVSNNYIYSSQMYNEPFYIYIYNDNVRIAHNTVVISSAALPYYGVMVNSNVSSPSNIKVMNNIFDVECSALDYNIYIGPSATRFTKVDGNDYFTGSVTGGLSSVTVFGTPYSSWKTLSSYFASQGMEIFGSNMKPVFVSAPTNLHLNQSVPNPSGVDAGVTTDFDGDSRCKLFPSSGADESNYGKTSKPVAKFYGPTTIYSAAPTTFYNTAKTGMPQTYKWYVNGTYITDSIHLTTQLATYPSVTIKLEVTNCAGTTSTTNTYSVVYPSAAPVSDFLSDKNTIQTNDIVRFTDLSTNGASSWQWSITPDNTYSFGVKVPTYKYVYGSDQAQNPQVQFLYSGKYKVCLTASNVLSGGKLGKGNTLCKTDYIYVLPAITLGSQSSTNEPKGYLYDDGGPNANYYATTSFPKNTVQGMVIDACADSTYLIFNSFSTACGYDYVKVYDGIDNTGTLLNGKCAGSSSKSTATGFVGLGPGYNGSASGTCTYSCAPNTGSAGIIDTFKAGKQMYIEMDIYPFSGNGAGFTAYWWTKARKEPKPVAKFLTSMDSHQDSICAGSPISFTNMSTGKDMTYQWELDDDFTDGFEATTKDAAWLWLFPTSAPVTLVVTNCGGTDTFTKYINVFAPAAPVASFDADNTTPTINDVVFLTSTVKQCVDDYLWTITNATPGDTGRAMFVMGTTKTNADPAVTFTDMGYYTVTLQVTNPAGTNSVTKTSYIHVKQGYCIPSVAVLNTGLGITEVDLNEIKSVSKQAVNDYTSYVNDQSLSTTLELGVTYPITIKRDTPYYEPITRTIYIDWNQDGVFESNEVVATDSNNMSSATWKTNIKVPLTAATGATVMRIAANRGTYTNYSCGQNQFGEYEDYRLHITPDRTPPLLFLFGKDTVKVEQGFSYVEPGDSAWDNLNGVITADIKRSMKPGPGASLFSLTGGALMIPGTYTILYNVKDAAGNAAKTKQRVVIVLGDTMRPDLQVAGPDTTFVPVNKSSTGYVNLPLVVVSYDTVDGPTADTITPQNIPVNKLDTVVVRYYTSDGSGNQAIVYRYVIVYDKVPPVLTFKGNQTENVEVNSSYTDPGVTTSDNYYTSAELDGLVKKTGGLDLTRLGTYTITYSLTDPSGNVAIPLTRTINVVDTVAPTVALNGNKSDTIEVYSTYIDKNVASSDNYYTSLTTTRTGSYYSTFPNGRATKLGSYTVIYSVTDGSGNKTTVTRFVTVVDKEAPVIKLIGDPSIAICRWFDYKDSGYTVHDNYYPTVKVEEEGTFISQNGATIQGLYSLRYKATDGSGNVAYSDYRYILVRPADDQLCKTGIKEGLSLDKYISVYPNPTSGLLTISADLPTQERVSMTITNALGQTVATLSNGNLSQNSFNVDLSGQVSGLYLLNITSSHDKVTKQIMLTR